MQGLVLLAVAPLEVKLVSEGFSITDLIGPFLLALAAIGAAYLAAATAKANHRRQLDSDRELRDREHIRDVLDTVAERSQATSWAIRDWRHKLAKSEKARDVLQLSGEIDVERRLKEISGAVLDEALELNQQGQEMVFDTIRLTLRLGVDHEIVACHDRWSDELIALSDAREVVADRNRSAEEITEDRELEKRVSKASTNFLAACTRWFTGRDDDPVQTRRSAT